MEVKDITAVVAILFGLYQIWAGFRAHRSSNLKAHITAGFLTGTPFLLVGAILLLGRGRGLGGWEILLLFVWLFGVMWRGWQEQRAGRRRTTPGSKRDPDDRASQDTILGDE